ncbi:MAG: zinc-ribbon domain-containing protein [bacterium]|nr:zinc-ribbon domain-containing protein [bacterium]
MVVVCGKCQRKFNLDDAKIPEAGVKVRCSKCGFTFLVQKPAPPQAEKPKAPAASPRPAAPAAAAAPPRVAPDAKKSAIIPKDEDFADIFQPEDAPAAPAAPATQAAPAASAAPEAEDEFRDLFAEEGKSPDSSPEDVFGDIFETSSPEEPAGPPPRASAPAIPKAPAPRKASKPEEPDDGQMGQEFKLDEFGSTDEGGFESPVAAAGTDIAPASPPVQSAPSSPAETHKTPEPAKDVPEWGSIKFGEETAADGPTLELAGPAKPAEPAPSAEKPKAVPEPKKVAEPKKAPEPQKMPSQPAPRVKSSIALGQKANYLLHTAFIVLMLFILMGVGERFILKNPVMLKRIGLGSLADDLYYRQIAKQHQLLPFGVKSYWMENQTRLPVLVIEGRAFNGTGSPLDVSQISVELSQPGGKPLATRVFPIGVPIELEEIRNLSPDELEAQIQKRAVGIHLPPSNEFAFRFPLPGIAIQELDYRLEVK